MMNFDNELEGNGLDFKDVLIFMVDEGFAERVAEEMSLDGSLPEMTREEVSEFNQYLISKIKELRE